MLADLRSCNTVTQQHSAL